MQAEHSSDTLMTRQEVADHFGIPKRFLEISAIRGDGPPMVKIGRLVRYRPSDIRQWLDEHTVTSTAAASRLNS